MFSTCFDDLLDFAAFENVDEMGDGEVLGPPAGAAAQIVDAVDDGLAIFGDIDLSKVHLRRRNKRSDIDSHRTIHSIK